MCQGSVLFVSFRTGAKVHCLFCYLCTYDFSYMCKGSLLVLLPVYIVLLNAETIHK